MKDVSESFGANPRAERKEYRAAKKDAFEKARDRGELKFDATTPLDSSFTSLTAATAANIFAKNKARKAVKSNFDKSYLANKASKNNSTIGSSESGASIPNSAESDYNKEKNAIEAKIEKNRNSYTPDTESQSIARNTYTPKNKDNSVKPTAPASNPSSSSSKGMAAAFSPERISQYKAKGWAMDNTTHRSDSSKPSSKPNTNTGEQNISNRIEELKKTGEMKTNTTPSKVGDNKQTSSGNLAIDAFLSKSKPNTKKKPSSGNLFLDYFNN
tara:strand:- start:260 stop:1072 length:813 start_codon:yes stop_codon:yes gene_type:complete